MDVLVIDYRIVNNEKRFIFKFNKRLIIKKGIFLFTCF